MSHKLYLYEFLLLEARAYVVWVNVRAVSTQSRCLPQKLHQVHQDMRSRPLVWEEWGIVSEMSLSTTKHRSRRR